MIPVTKPHFPSREKLNQYIDGIYERQWLTNNGQLVQELTQRLEDYLGVKNLLLVANGTLALQIAYRALSISGDMAGKNPEAITTPFTFIATASSLKWDGVKPIFADIDPDSWCLNPNRIEEKITPNTRAIVPVHVFGNACDVESIDVIAKKHQLKVIYDASHAFGVTYKGDSLLKHGDAATLSFHATKLFHTGEGGAIIFKNKKDLERAKKMINFGIAGPETIKEIGINAKMNELQAAMGLCVLDEIEDILKIRRKVWHGYAKSLDGRLQLQSKNSASDYNYCYFPALFESEKKAVEIKNTLEEKNITTRRYFHPPLDSISFLGNKKENPVSDNIASRILCLPIYPSLPINSAKDIANQISTLLMDSSPNGLLAPLGN